MKRMFVALLVLLAILAPPARATEAGWALVRDGGQVVLLRNARVSGAGAPSGFDIAKCRSTLR